VPILRLPARNAKLLEVDDIGLVVYAVVVDFEIAFFVQAESLDSKS
jgi:hypothetical protein